MRTLKKAVLLTALVGALSGVAMGQDIVAVPFPSGADADFSVPFQIRVSGDGKTFGITYSDDPSLSLLDGRSFRWVPFDNLIRLEDLDPANGRSGIWGLNHEGNIVVARHRSGSSRTAIRWIDSTSPTQASPEIVQNVRGSNSDASTIVGNRIFGGLNRAFRWTEGSGYENLGALSGATVFSQAEDVSDDGSVITGFSSSDSSGFGALAFLWTESEGITEIQPLPGDTRAQGLRVSGDGSVVIGQSWLSPADFNNARRAYRWTEQDGISDLGALPGATIADVRAITQNGAVIAGNNLMSDGTRVATVWTEATGTIEAANYFAAFGLDLSGWSLERIDDVSAIGDVFVGRGEHNGASKFFVVDLSPAFPPLISFQPAELTFVDAGTTVELSVGVQFGTPPIEYQWRRNGVPLAESFPFSGTDSNTLTILAATGGQTDFYDVVVSNDFGTATSTQALVAVRQQTCIGDIADEFGFTATEGGGPDGVVDFGDFVALLGLIGPCP